MYYLLGENNGVMVDENESPIHFKTENEAIEWAEKEQMWSLQVMEGELRYSDVFHPKSGSRPGEVADRQPVCPTCGRRDDDRPD
jgi:hypothetical protein